MVQTKEQIFSLLQQHKAQLKSFGVKRCGLFGSFLRGQPTNTSDVDLLVEFEPQQKAFDNFMNLAFFLEETFGRKVELLTPESLNNTAGRKSCLRLNMRRSVGEYLQHILDKASYLNSSVLDAEQQEFLESETLKRAPSSAASKALAKR